MPINATSGHFGACAEPGYATDHILDLLGGDQPGAFELAWRVLVTRTPQVILVVEAHAHIVPTTIAGVVVDDPVWRGELIGRVGETADHHDRDPSPPGQPRKAA